MSTRPEAGSPDELMWLRGFEEARNHFLAENARLREALKFYARKHSDFCASWNYPQIEVDRYCDCIDTRNARATLEGK